MLTIFGRTRQSKSSQVMRISSVCDPVLKAIFRSLAGAGAMRSI